MRLKSLWMTNYRSHADTKLEFGLGVTAIVGDNETGKSSIFEAIEWVLFGAVAVRGKVDTLKWHRAVRPPGVSLVFELGGERYEVMRSTTAAKMMAGEEGCGVHATEIAHGTSAVNGKVQELLGMTHAQFVSSYLSRQGEMGRISAMTPMQRKEFVREVLGVSVLTKAAKVARRYLNKAREERESLPSCDHPAPLDEMIRRVGEEVKHFDRTALDMTAAAVRKQREMAEVKEDAETAREDSARYAKHVAEGYQLKNRVRACEEFLYEAKGSVEEAESREAKIRSLELELAASPDPSRFTAQKEHKKAERRIFANMTRVSNLNADLSEIRRQTERLECGECLSCGQKIDEENVTAKVSSGELVGIEALTAKKKEIKAAINDTKLESLKLSRERKALSARVAEEAESRYQTALMNSKLDHLKEARAGKADRKRAGLEVEVAAKELKAAKARLDLHKRKSEGLSQEDVEENLKCAMKEIEHTADDINAFREAARNAEDSSAKAAAELASLKEFQASERKRDALVSREEAAETALKHLLHLRDDAARSVAPELEDLITAYVTTLTSGRHEGVLIDDKLQVEALEEGVPTSVISGGTKDIVALSMRLALGELISRNAGHPLSLLMLDEPFGSLDEKRRRAVIELLQDLPHEQVITTSHVAETKDIAAHVVKLAHEDGRTVVR